VHFSASWPDVWRINLHSRIASRVLVRIVQGRYRDENDIHRLALAQDWMQWFDVGRTLRVDTTAGSGKHKSPLKSLEFVTLRVKDGICDRFRDAVGKRPDVDTRTPDVRVFAYLDANTCTLYLDTSGEPLFKRGWRTEAGMAPLRENLAAGILRLADWKPGTALLDPMCGSGSFVVEAAQTALKIAPGAVRSFGFERLKNFDADAWRRLKADATSLPDEAALAAVSLLHASDVSGDAVVMTRANLERAGVPVDLAAAIAPKQIDARQVKPHADHGIVVMNPPYGERIAIRGERSERGAQPSDDELAAFFVEFGNTLKQRFAGWNCHVLTSDMNLQKKLRLAPDRRVVLFNGAIECRLYRFVLVAGQNR
jgi:putative N6-adenine-specific DNA methylase